LYVEISPSDYHVLHPRPAYLIVSRSRDGVLNVMAASWVMPVSEEPPYIVLSIDRETRTYRNIVETREFTINIVGVEHVDIVYKAGSISGWKIDKWRLLGLKPASSKHISVPGIQGSYGYIECVVEKMFRAGECDLVLCSPKAIHVRNDLYTRYGWDLGKARIIMHQRGRVFVLPGKLVFAHRAWRQT
jgi:flavin reductase (DIM6/NTAB) family NADH-FMN oxidoreductase RutF